MRLLENYRVGDRVNSSRGPGEDPKRPMRCAHEATEQEKRYAVDEHGYLVFPATVVEVQEARLKLRYDTDGDEVSEGWEEMRHVTPRVCMPWHPKFLRGDFSILLRRNVGRGVVMEGLEVRWWLVSALLKEGSDEVSQVVSRGQASL